MSELDYESEVAIPESMYFRHNIQNFEEICEKPVEKILENIGKEEKDLIQKLKEIHEETAFRVFVVLCGVKPGSDIIDDENVLGSENLSEEKFLSKEKYNKIIGELEVFSEKNEYLGIKHVNFKKTILLKLKDDLMEIDDTTDFHLFYNKKIQLDEYADAYIDSVQKDDNKRIEITGSLFFGIPLCDYGSLRYSKDTTELVPPTEHKWCKKDCRISMKRKEKIEELQTKYTKMFS